MGITQFFRHRRYESYNRTDQSRVMLTPFFYRFHYTAVHNTRLLFEISEFPKSLVLPFLSFEIHIINLAKHFLTNPYYKQYVMRLYQTKGHRKEMNLGGCEGKSTNNKAIKGGISTKYRPLVNICLSFQMHHGYAL